MPCLEHNGRWKGGEWVNSKGYVMVLVGREHPMANCRAYAPLCRVVLYETKGPPAPGQHAHHIDGNKQNDEPDNLEWQYPTEHGRWHLPPDRAREIGRKGGKAAAKNRRRARRERERFTQPRRRTQPRRKAA